MSFLKMEFLERVVTVLYFNYLTKSSRTDFICCVLHFIIKKKVAEGSKIGRCKLKQTQKHSQDNQRTVKKQNFQTKMFGKWFEVKKLP